MRLRDRRGPLTALVMAVGYLLLVLVLLRWMGALAGFQAEHDISPLLAAVLWVNAASILWRAAWRFAFTAREYGGAEGVRAILRIPLANIIAIMAGRRALASYISSLDGKFIRWDKTSHMVHPAIAAEGRAAP